MPNNRITDKIKLQSEAAQLYFVGDAGRYVSELPSLIESII